MSVRSLARRRTVINLSARGFAAVLGLGLLQTVVLAQAPDESWRTIRTDHFRVTFPERLEPLGRRAADRAEVAYAALSSAFLEAPGGLIDVLVTDHTDVSNGFAQVTPSDRITVFARPPVDALNLGHFDDWMELVITHELAHIVHLDRTDTLLGKVLRGLFGRTPTEWPYFPGLATPGWVTEGIATWFESSLTQSGRVRGTYHEMQLRTAILEGRFENFGQASGSSPVWPEGNRAYAYGSLFFGHLVDRYGEGSVADFAEAISGQWIPYRLNAAGRSAFGVSISDAWEEWRTSLVAKYVSLDSDLEALGPVTEPERLSFGERRAVHPAVSPDGAQLAYLRSDGRSDNQLRIRDQPDQSGRSLARVNGSTTFDWLNDGRLVVSQLDFADPYRTYGDLYLVDAGGDVRRLTHDARLSQPSGALDGSSVVAVRQGDGTNSVVRLVLETGQVEQINQPALDVHWAYPRLSPDGRWIVATRWSSGALHDIVVLDARSGRVVSEVTRDRAMDVAPRWSPDGRWIVWSSDRTGILNLLAARFDPDSGSVGVPVLLTNVRTGATYPSVDPSGDWLYFSGYHVDGWELERIPFQPEGGRPAPPAIPRFDDSAGTRREFGEAEGEIQNYSAFPTLLPRYWEPLYREPVRTPAVQTPTLFLRSREVLGAAVGAQTAGRDLVGRHRYDAFGRVFTSGGKVEGGFGYAFSGAGNPVLSFGVSQFWDDDGAAVNDPVTPTDTLFVLERERSVSASLTFRAPRWRRNLVLTLTGGMVWEGRELLGNDLRPTSAFQLARPNSKLSDLRASVTFTTARSHVFQMGGARGLSVFLSGRLRNELSLPDSIAGRFGEDRSVDDVIGRVRAYLPLWRAGYSRHVIALQVNGGTAFGPNAGPGHFDVGGAAGGSETVTGLSLFGGSPIFFAVRGYPASARFGRYAWSASAEYRIPLALVHRGFGGWPLHFDRLMGSLFMDAGNAWGPDVTPSGAQNPLRSTLYSAGAELATGVMGLYDAQLTLRAGVAVPFVSGFGTSVYVRLGLPF
jgi:Tol biopolymer transport system component